MDKMYVTMEHFEKAVSFLASMEHSKYQAIYGVPSGGVPVAMALAHKWNLPIVDKLDNEKNILVVDDVIDSGKTRTAFKNHDFMCLHNKSTVLFPGQKLTVWYQYVPQDTWIVYWWESSSCKSISDSVVRQLQYLGEDVTREGLKETPRRVISSWQEIYSGYGYDGDDIEELFTVFNEDSCSEMVVLKNIEFFSMCEHHMLPFFGKAHIAYIPDKKIVGISKLARVLEVYSRRLQVQERLCQQVTGAIWKHLQPKGCACILEAEHLCMRMRGVNKQESIMITSSLLGCFRDVPSCKAELMSFIKQ